MKKILVAYFSASGITKKLAQRFAQAIGADLFEICPKVPYTTADLNWTDRNSRSSVEMRDLNCRPEITKLPDITPYETIFVGFPIWWYRQPSIIDTFMEKCPWNGQTVIPFATSGGSSLGDSAKNLQRLAPKAKLKDGRRFSANESTQQLADWAQSVM